MQCFSIFKQLIYNVHDSLTTISNKEIFIQNEIFIKVNHVQFFNHLKTGGILMTNSTQSHDSYNETSVTMKHHTCLQDEHLERYVFLNITYIMTCLTTYYYVNRREKVK